MTAPTGSSAAAPGDDAPLSPAEADRLFAPLAPLGLLAVAVSGGADSTALLLLLHDWTRRADAAPRLVVLTVDHGLRAEAAAECARVADLAARLGLEAEILAADPGAFSGTGLQDAARRERHRLFAQALARRGATDLALAHHRDDQAETFLMRLSRGSGLRGLSAMAPRRRVGALTLHRPLLGVPRSRLRASLLARGEPWCEDPSNASPRFLRARLRALMPALAEVGIDAATLAATAVRLARASVAVDDALARLDAAAVRWHDGAFSIDRAAFRAAPREVASRLLADLVRDMSGAPYGPRAAPVDEVMDELHAVDAPASVRRPLRRTLAGVVVDARRERIWLHLEAGRGGFRPVPVTADGRVRFSGGLDVVVEGLGAAGAEGAVLEALGRVGRGDVEAAGLSLPGPAGVREALVVLRAADGRLLAAPGPAGAAFAPVRITVPRPGEAEAPETA